MTRVSSTIGEDNRKRSPPHIKNSRKELKSKAMLKPGKFPNSPNIKVSVQATKVSIMIQRKRMMNLLIIKLMRDTGIVSKFFSMLDIIL